STPTMSAMASREVCIAPSETSRVVASLAGCPAFKTSHTMVVSAAGMAVTHRRCRGRTPVSSTFGAAQGFDRQGAGNPAPGPTTCPDDYVAESGARQLRRFHHLVSRRTQTRAQRQIGIGCG